MCFYLLVMFLPLVFLCSLFVLSFCDVCISWNTLPHFLLVTFSQFITFMRLFSHNRRTFFCGFFFLSICKPRNIMILIKLEYFLWKSKQFGNNIGAQGPWLQATHLINIISDNAVLASIKINGLIWKALICNVRLGNIVLHTLKTIQA